MRKREKAGNHDKERTCMCACVCLRLAEGRRCVWGGTFEISIWNSRGYRYASCFPPAITTGFPFLFCIYWDVSAHRRHPPGARPRVTRSAVVRSQRRRDVAPSRYFTTFCFLSAGRKRRGTIHAASRTLFDFYGVKSWWSVSRMDFPSSLSSAQLSSFSFSFAVLSLLLAIVALLARCRRLRLESRKNSWRLIHVIPDN